MFSEATAIVRGLLFFSWTLLAAIPYGILRTLRWRYREFGLFYWKVVARICRVIVRTRGALVAERPVVVVSNHTSYMDIVVLGRLIPGVFVAKSEVGGWPVFGWMARMARTVFIDRKRGSTARNRAEIEGRLAEGEPLILFPEGTSNDGNRVYRFKSALFSIAENPVILKGERDPKAVTVQPVSLAYTWVDGVPVGRAWRPIYAWYGDMELAPHLFRLLGFGVVTVDVIFHAPVLLSEFGSRKALSDHCQRVVARGVEGALTGRLDDPAPALAPPEAVDPPGPPLVSRGEGVVPVT
ncbi:MAG: 1-acyl-sn-glycerol-3-phosphate acyltransferase [Rhodospirillum sp.]|nr:1-acyl-sn-glycerol-3-phosphate acyltransferase [Rhodospirillum sp.]MCF8487972.1 1-acyl-sn-glycerol-3-phosphate acyltransferase [Rhodospirillum sp.]MCF8499319.1 1-acyl-sn-glycerol-3-phosphate acyltransferase [Rhodospirillum sp.]